MSICQRTTKSKRAIRKTSKILYWPLLPAFIVEKWDHESHAVLNRNLPWLFYQDNLYRSPIQKSSHLLIINSVRSTGSLKGLSKNETSDSFLCLSFIHTSAAERQEKKKTPAITIGLHQDRHHAPERRCSSRTFRYGYLVTT